MITPSRMLYERFQRMLWMKDPERLRLPLRWILWMLRLVYVVVRDLVDGELALRAMSLVYTTLLSFVPLLAFSFSVLKAFGAHGFLQPILLRFLEPMGQMGVQLAGQIMQFVDRMKVGVLGAVGLAFLLYTVVSLLQKIEAAFNHVWQVRRLRPLAGLFSNYLRITLTGTVLVFSALGITASIMNTRLVRYLVGIEPFGTLILSTSKLLPYLLVSLAFTFIYVFFPNTRVQVRAAAVGGFLAGVLWQTTVWVFAGFIASSARYTAIYSGFAIVILLLIWLYLNWMVLLVGAKVAFYVQHPHYMARVPVRMELSNRMRERLVLHVMHRIGLAHFGQRAPLTLDDLAEEIGVPVGPVTQVVDALLDEGFLVEVCGREIAYLPARELETIRVRDLLHAVRSHNESGYLNRDMIRPRPEVDRVVEGLEAAWDRQLDGMTLRDLVAAAEGEVQGREVPAS
ncbi:MAG: YihY family inner membrane protein [Gammaproteobacteria bacterium]|nr:MAG: YihY family inner membrane protein [Gammaproteobacteria bacterium]